MGDFERPTIAGTANAPITSHTVHPSSKCRMSNHDRSPNSGRKQPTNPITPNAISRRFMEVLIPKRRSELANDLTGCALLVRGLAQGVLECPEQRVLCRWPDQ